MPACIGPPEKSRGCALSATSAGRLKRLALQPYRSVIQLQLPQAARSQQLLLPSVERRPGGVRPTHSERAHEHRSSFFA